MGIFTAMYDPATDKITGCKEYGFIWHHEDRHRQQFTCRLGQIYQNIEMVIFRIACSFLVVMGLIFPEDRFLFFAGAGALLVFPTVMVIFLELDAWVYSVEKYLKGETR
jgi:hypothetical protein